MHVYFIAFGISLLCVLGSIALRRTKWQPVVWLPAILLPMVVLLDVFGVMPVSIALGPHSFTGFTIQIWFWYSAVPIGGVAILFLVLGAIFFPRDRALNVSAFLVGIALSTGTLYGLYLRETEVISVRVISAAGQPVPNQEVIFLGTHSRDGIFMQTNEAGITALRLRKGKWRGCEVQSPSGVVTFLGGSSYPVPTRGGTSWHHESWPLRQPGPHLPFAKEFRTQMPFVVQLREVNDVTSDLVRDEMKKILMAISSPDGNKEQVSEAIGMLRGNIEAVEFLDLLSPVYEKHGEQAAELNVALADLARRVGRMAAAAESVRREQLLGLKSFSHASDYMRACTWFQLSSEPQSIQTNAPVIRDAICEVLTKILSVSEAGWTLDEPRTFEASIVEARWSLRGGGEEHVRIFPDAIWLNRLVESCRKSKSEMRFTLFGAFRRFTPTIDEARPYFGDSDPWITVAAIGAVERLIPNKDVPEVIRLLRTATSNGDERLRRNADYVIRSLEETVRASR